MSEALDFLTEEKQFIHTFSIKYHSKIYKKTFEGTFVSKKMSIGDHLKIGIIKSDLLEGKCHDLETGKGVPKEVDQLAEMIAICRVVLIRKPDWFNDTLTLRDTNVLFAVCREVDSYESSFRPFDEEDATEAHQGEAEESEGSVDSSADSSDTQCSIPASVDEDKKVVDKKVPSIRQIGTV